MNSFDLSLLLIAVGIVALIGGFSARRYSWGVALMYGGVLVLLGTVLKMIVVQIA